MSAEHPLFVGIDLGTSGCRAVAVDREGGVHAEAGVAMPLPRREGDRSEQDPAIWRDAVNAVLARIAQQIDPASAHALAVDGTSGTLLLADEAGAPLTPALMYDDGRSRAEAELIARIAPPDCAAHGTGSALAKLLHLQHGAAASRARFAQHQADWIMGRLCGRFGVSDENNCLKMGYDPVQRRWPDWIGRIGADTRLLPRVVRPGSVVGSLSDAAVLSLGYPPRMRIVAGTTDSVAAFIATGASAVGDAVTSLGSTLVLKVLSATPVFAPGFGVYSHPLGDLWLAGGGSNSGGAVLLRHFTLAQMDAMTPMLRPERETGLDFYPLGAPGERFPYNDPCMAPRLDPRPADDLVFFQAMLEGMARIEALGYRRLTELGAPPPRRLMTVGGGARNPAWTRIRERMLGLTFEAPRSNQACYGAAMLALRSETAASHPEAH